MWAIYFIFQESWLRNDLSFPNWKEFLSSILHTQGFINSVNCIQKAIHLIVNYSKWCRWWKGTPICNAEDLFNGYPEECCSSLGRDVIDGVKSCMDLPQAWKEQLGEAEKALWVFKELSKEDTIGGLDFKFDNLRSRIIWVSRNICFICLPLGRHICTYREEIFFFLQTSQTPSLKFEV